MPKKELDSTAKDLDQDEAQQALQGKLDQLDAKLEEVDSKLEEVNSKIDLANALSEKFDAMEKRADEIEARFENLTPFEEFGKRLKSIEEMLPHAWGLHNMNNLT